MGNIVLGSERAGAGYRSDRAVECRYLLVCCAVKSSEKGCYGVEYLASSYSPFLYDLLYPTNERERFFLLRHK